MIWRFVGLLLISGFSQAASLIAGPMAGPPTHRLVTLWLQADGPAKAAIQYWPQSRPGDRRLTTPLKLLESDQFVGKFSLPGLEPGSTYQYRILLDGKPAGGAKVFTFSTQSLWQWRKPAPDFTVLASSCNYGNEEAFDRPGKPYGDQHEVIFKTMAAQAPDLTLWLGDNLYFREVDYSSPQGMAARWARERQRSYLQTLLQTGSHAAVWDDHDFGPNDSNRSFVFKREALALQQRYWPNPSFGLPELPGAFGQFSLNDVDFFLLDDRYHRDDFRLNSSGRAMFGNVQMDWLKNALLNSTAAFKVIAAGTQMLHKSERGESWQYFPAERDDFLKFLEETRLNGVFFLSGDVHRSELTRLERPAGYPLLDLTCSPLTAGVYVDEKLRQRPNLVPGTVVMGERNFCHLRFEGGRNDRRLVMRVLNDTGQPRWSHTFTQLELSYQKP